MSNNSNVDVLKVLGLDALNAGRLDQAQGVYADILRTNPSDVDAHLALGDIYLADGDSETAFLLYSRAVEIAPEHLQANQRLRLAQMEVQTRAPARPASPPPAQEPITRLLGRAQAHAATISEEQLSLASSLLEAIRSSETPAETVALRLDEIHSLLPALIELNARQAEAEARPDLVKALRALQSQLETENPLAIQADVPAMPRIQFSNGGPHKALDLTVALIAPGDAADVQIHHQRLLESLARFGVRGRVMPAFPEDARPYDLAIVCRAHQSNALIDGMTRFSATGKPILLDVEMDYEQLPLTHPDSASLGLVTPARARAYAAALYLADWVCVPSATLAEKLRGEGRRVEVIPSGWSKTGQGWEKPSPARHTVNIGWFGLPGQLDDIALARRPLIRILREFPNTQLIIGGDPQAYQLFSSIPEGRKLYLPPANAEDRPYLLSHVDILLAPLRRTPFNLTMPERPLLEAGIRAIPWVASPIPAYEAWGAGGMIAKANEEWYTHLREMVNDLELRESLGFAGRRQADQREAGVLAHAWVALLQRVLLLKRVRSMGNVEALVDVESGV